MDALENIPSTVGEVIDNPKLWVDKMKIVVAERNFYRYCVEFAVKELKGLRTKKSREVCEALRAALEG